MLASLIRNCYVLLSDRYFKSCNVEGRRVESLTEAVKAVYTCLTFQAYVVVLQKYENEYVHGHLEEALNSHWAEYVPVVYKAKVDVDAANEERKANKFLLRPLEQFICKGNPDFVFKQLKEYDKPSHLCGRSFKNGEPTYSCRYDVFFGLCVLLVQCNLLVL